VGANGWAASANGTFVYAQGSNASGLVLVARDGRSQPLGKELRAFANPRASPDGKRIAVNIGVRRASTLWIYTLGSETLSPFTNGGGTANPVWSRDGSQITYAILRDTGGHMIARRASDGSGAADTIIRGQSQRFPFEWSPDGRTLVYDEQRTPGMQVVANTLGDTAVRAVADWAATSRLPRLSPDGHWVAYASNASGRYEVYVSPFPGPGGHWQVSTDFGDQPVWAHNGHELFYRDRDSVVVATVKTSPAFEVVSRRKLFADPYVRGNTGDWDVMPDDQRFVMLRTQDITGQFTIVSNWLLEFRTLMGIK
jgi:Tol biopolymer transport system component